MDTNVKEFKYSVWTKIICIVLAVLTFSTSTAMIVRTVTSALYMETNDDVSSSWTDNHRFQNYFGNDVSSLIELSYYEELDNDFHDALAEQKQAVVDEVYRQYLIKKKQYQSSRIESEEYYDHYVENVETTEAFEDTITVSIGEIAINDVYTINEDFKISYNTLSKVEDVEYEAGPLQQYIGDDYDRFAKSKSVYNYLDAYNDWENYRADRSRNSLRYFTKRGEYVHSNISEQYGDSAFDEQSYNEESDVYFISRQGEMEYKGITEDFANELYGRYIKPSNYAMEADIYIYLTMPGGSDSKILNPRYWNDIYINLYNFYHTAFKYSHNVTETVIIESILMIIAFVSGIYALTIAGKRKDGTTKIVFIDKIPFLIHTAITGALMCGAGTLYLYSVDQFLATEYSNLFVILSGLAAFIGWILLFELCSSIARYIHSGRKVKDNFLTYQFGKFAVRLSGKAKQALAYKPGTFKNKVIILTILYFAVNLLVMGIAYLCAYNAILISIIILAADAIANAFIIKKVLAYIKNLDTIITAFSNHQEPEINIDTLPNSLKILAESMKYTNEELQNAVNKAIKDERLRSELITNVSHDLKTPLTSIITYVDLLSKCDISDEKAKEYIGVLDDKGDKLKRLIDDLIEASKVTSGNVTVTLASINLSELCMQSTVDAQADFEKAGLNLIVKDCEQPPIVTGDGAKTFRVIENLLSNARKYSAVSSRVYVNVYSENGYGIFEIKNISAQPLDISPDELTERFVRGDKSRNQEGNGLGLSIAKELCTLQNGRLELTIDGDLFKAKVKLPLA